MSKKFVVLCAFLALAFGWVLGRYTAPDGDKDSHERILKEISTLRTDMSKAWKELQKTTPCAPRPAEQVLPKGFSGPEEGPIPVRPAETSLASQGRQINVSVILGPNQSDKGELALNEAPPDLAPVMDEAYFQAIVSALSHVPLPEMQFKEKPRQEAAPVRVEVENAKFSPVERGNYQLTFSSVNRGVRAGEFPALILGGPNGREWTRAKKSRVLIYEESSPGNFRVELSLKKGLKAKEQVVFDLGGGHFVKVDSRELQKKWTKVPKFSGAKMAKALKPRDFGKLSLAFPKVERISWVKTLGPTLFRVGLSLAIGRPDGAIISAVPVATSLVGRITNRKKGMEE